MSVNNPCYVQLSRLYRSMRPALIHLGRKDEVLRELKKVAESMEGKDLFYEYLDLNMKSIDEAFVWGDSPQGFAYWNVLYKAILKYKWDKDNPSI